MNYEKISINLSSTHTINLASNKRATLFVFNGFESLQSGFTYPRLNMSGELIKSVGPGETVDIYMLNNGNSIHTCSLTFSETSINVNAISNSNGILNVTVSETDSINVDGTNSPVTDINWGGHKITSLYDPSSNQDIATKHYVDSASSSGTYTETDPLSIHINNSNEPTNNINWGGHKIIDLKDPTNDQDAVTLKYFNDHINTQPPPSTPGDRGVFGGSDYATIDYITISSPGNALDFGDLTVDRSRLAATSNGINDRGVFGGGMQNYSGGTNHYNVIDYITISTIGDAIDFGNLSSVRSDLAATSNGTNNRGVFGGGYINSNYTNVIDYIDISSLGNASHFGNLTEAREELAATSNGTNDRGVFGGGDWSSNIIDYITISTPGTAIDFGDLQLVRSGLAATSNGIYDRGVFGGGYNNGSTSFIDYVIISTPANATHFGSLTVGRSDLAATSNGTNDRGVFGGGYNNGSGSQNIIDYITISSPGNAIDFGDLTQWRECLGATSNSLT